MYTQFHAVGGIRTHGRSRFYRKDDPLTTMPYAVRS